jgi:protein involved in polysaccharide export with SLBB domain
MTFGILASALAALALQGASATDAAALQAANSAQPAPPANNAYILGVGDKIRIVVFEEPSLSGPFSVAANGDIAFPLIGPVKAAGLAPEQLESAIAGLLNNGYLKDSRVNVEVLTFRPYYILGEVTKPGEYPYSSGLTVLNAVATAGGFSYRANQKRVFIKRIQDNTEHLESLTPSVMLYPGDTIRITERYF